MNREPAREDTRLRQAAVIVSSLEPDAAQAVKASLSARQLAALERAERSVGELTAAQRQQLVQAFTQELQQGVGGGSATWIEAPIQPTDANVHADGGPLSGAIVEGGHTDGDDRVDAAPFDFLEEFPPDLVVGSLSAERPEIIALIVTHCDAQIARQLVGALPARVGYAVGCVVSEQELRPRPGVVRSIARELEGHLCRQARKRIHTRERVFTIAEALCLIDGDLAGEFVDRIRRVDAKLAEELRDYVCDGGGMEPDKADGDGAAGGRIEPVARATENNGAGATEEQQVEERAEAAIGAAAAAT